MVYRQNARSEAVRAESRERILHAAMKLFVERGYDATTMQDIVAEAGTSIGNAYFYFGSKERLVGEMIEAAAHAALDQSERAAATIPAGPARIGAMIAARVSSFMGTSQDLAKLLLATDQRLGTVQIVEDITIARWIDQLAESFPKRRASELPAIAAAIWGVNRAIIQRVTQGKLEMDQAAVVRFAVRWSLRALDVAEQEIESIIRASLRRGTFRDGRSGKRAGAK
jgi:AcrR family transcriptional regulator